MTNIMLATVISKNSPVLLVHCTVVSHNPLKPASILHKMRFTSFRTVAACLDYVSALKLTDSAASYDQAKCYHELPLACQVLAITHLACRFGADLSNTRARSKHPGHSNNGLHCIVHMFCIVLAWQDEHNKRHECNTTMPALACMQS